MRIKKPKMPTRERTPLPSSTQTRYSYSSKRLERAGEGGLNREVDRENASQTRPKPRKIKHLPWLIIVFIAMVGLFYMLTVDNNVRITTKASDSLFLRDKNTYQSSAEQFIASSPINRLKLTFDSRGLINKMKKQFPEVSAVSVSFPIITRKPTVVLQTTKPGFILNSGQNSYVIGVNGVALLDVRDVDHISKLGLRTVRDESNVALEVGKPALPQEQALFISNVVEQLEKQGYEVESLTIPKSPYDLHVKLVGRKYYIKFNVLEDPKQQAGAFIALMQTLESQQKTPNEYVDVRVGERVFYK